MYQIHFLEFRNFILYINYLLKHLFISKSLKNEEDFNIF